MNRRRLLAAIGSGAVAVQAGCLTRGNAGPGDADDTNDDSDDGNGSEGDSDGANDGGENDDTDEPDVQPAVRDHSIETVKTDCLSDEDEESLEVEFGSDRVSLDGIAAAPDPCHEAAIESAVVDTGELRVDLAFEETGEMCSQCVGAIHYSATIELDGADGLDTVTVEHGEEGGTFTETRGGD